MEFIKFTKSLLASTALAISIFTHGPLQASSVTDYLKEFPWIGLISDEITYGPITISNVSLDHSDKLVFANPGETLHGNLRYKLNSEKDKLNLHHLIVGIEGVGAQDCVMHSFGLWDTKGKGKFTLTAPSESGVYEVRFLYNEGLTCSKAREAWNSGQKDPSAYATIGIIIVK